MDYPPKYDPLFHQLLRFMPMEDVQLVVKKMTPILTSPVERARLISSVAHLWHNDNPFAPAKDESIGMNEVTNDKGARIPF